LSDDVPGVPAAGWFADPDPTNGQLRWWNGAAWTEHTAPRPVEVAPPPLRGTAVGAGGRWLEAQSAPPSPYTPWVWVMVGAPFISMASYGARAALPWAAGTIVWMLLSLAVFVLLVVSAFFDSATLRSRGFTNPAHGAWVFLIAPLVYLSLRSSRVHKQVGKGNAPANLYVLALLLSVVVYVALMGVPTPSACSACGSPTGIVQLGAFGTESVGR
jgi:hypothetical protein